jgi:ABC-2 type transport system permease protein
MKKSLYTILVFARINVRRLFRDKVALFFTFAFPLIFLLIFGGIFGHNANVSFSVAVLNESHSPYSEQFIKSIGGNKTFKIKSSITNMSEADQQMSRSEIDATLVLPASFGAISSGKTYPTGQIIEYYDENNAEAAQTLATVLQAVLANTNAKFVPAPIVPFAVKAVSTNQAGLSQFDYTFSGLLGFTIIGLGIFGPVNIFPELKKQGILRRLHVTPLRVWQYFLSNVLSQSVIGLMAVAVMFAVAKVLFHLQMRGSYLSLAVVVVLGVWTIFGIGLAIGGWAKNENQAAPLANLIVFPLMFLTGVFFPTFLMPQWLQNISSYLPLTPIINSIRMVITENASLISMSHQIGLTLAWAVVIYIIAFRVFRWE